MSAVWVILPTYQEAGNVERTVRAVLAAVPGVRVRVVDDSSPDGTGAIADRLAAEEDAVEVLHRPRKSGLGRAADGPDVVLGSRYVPGGGIADWGPLRRAVSRLGCGYARRVLGVGVRDLTGGFKAFRASALEAIDYGSVRSQGYPFQVELTYRALRRGLRVEEVPIVFREREHGTSKMSAPIAVEAVWLVPALRFGRRRSVDSGEPADLPIT